MTQYMSNIKSGLKRFSLRSLISMAKFMPSREDKQSIIINNVDVRPVQRRSQDIQTWRIALMNAEGIYQQRNDLFTLYDEILLDGHLSAVIEKRISRITNAAMSFRIKDKPVEEIEKLMRTSAWETLLRESLNARFWGHSLIELNFSNPGENQNNSTILINRRYVKPRFELVTRNAHDMNGIKYTESPYVERTIEVGGAEDLGILLKCCPHVIFKRGAFGDWIEFAEVFGMPLRWATYQNEQSREILNEALAKAGSAGYVVAPEGSKIEFQSPTGNSGNDIFSSLRSALNEEISVTVLGNTMTTTEAKSSGYAQSLTHGQEQSEVHADDKAYILRVLNEKLIPYLARIGYQTEGGEFSFIENERMSLKDRLDIALKVADKVNVGDSYWYETFGIPRPQKSDISNKGGDAKK
jgi:hypothetical protein